MTITIESNAFRQLMKKLNRIEAIALAAKNTDWVSEDEAEQITGLGKRSLLEKRKKGLIEWRTASGRKIQYKRNSLDNYLNSAS